MTAPNAHAILQMMLDGIDPTTGEILPEDHFCHDPSVIRALHSALQTLPSDAAPESGLLTKRGRLRADRPWTDEDHAALAELFRAGASSEEMAHRLQRRVRGVENQLRYLGLLPEKNASAHASRTGQPWSQVEDQQLREMYRHRLSIREMAKALRRSEYAIFCRMVRFGLSGSEPGYPSPEDCAQPPTGKPL